jgi:hypothetical protein
MVCKAWTPGASEHLPEAKLTSRGRREIFAADDVGDPLQQVIDGHRKLIGPVTVAIAQQEIAALTCGFLLDGAKEQVIEHLHTFADANA